MVSETNGTVHVVNHYVIMFSGWIFKRGVILRRLAWGERKRFFGLRHRQLLENRSHKIRFHLRVKRPSQHAHRAYHTYRIEARYVRQAVCQENTSGGLCSQIARTIGTNVWKNGKNITFSHSNAYLFQNIVLGTTNSNSPDSGRVSPAGNRNAEGTS